MISDRRLAESWIAYTRATIQRGPDHADADEHWWAIEKLIEYCGHSPVAALGCIQEILAISADADLLDNLAAGPLESLLANQGPEIIADVERLAAENRRFKDLLGGVWKNRMTDEVWTRVQQAGD